VDVSPPGAGRPGFPRSPPRCEDPPCACRGPHFETRANPHWLTRRQLEVAQLLRESLSDAEIAARLVITPKTTSGDVSAILAKLDVHTRYHATRKRVHTLDDDP